MKNKNRKHTPHSIPDAVELTEAENEALTTRVEARELADEDWQLVLKSLEFMRWLQFSLHHTKITIRVTFPAISMAYLPIMVAIL